MATNYNDERLKSVESQKGNAMAEVGQVYSDMINQSDQYYQAQIDATKAWEEKQTQLQQERTDFTIEQIEQQKEQAHKDYTREQSASYADWQKESNKYGANAEEMASNGLSNTGYSESSQVSMYNTYQNRVATAKESYNRAVLNYNNAIKEAILQNNSILAEIAYNSLQKQLEISLAGFQYKNQLVLGQLDTKLSVDDSYHSRYMDVLSQINNENSLAEQIRQYNEKLAEDKRQYDTSLTEQIRQYNEKFAEDKRQYDTSLAEQIRQYNEKLAEDKRQYNSSLAMQQAQLDWQKAKASSSDSESVIMKNDSNLNDSIRNAKVTGFGVGNVLSKNESSMLGLSRTSKIVIANGKYYAKDGDNYIDLTPIQDLISSRMKLSTPTNIKTMR